jgi:hypothetical protein
MQEKGEFVIECLSLEGELLCYSGAISQGDVLELIEAFIKGHKNDFVVFYKPEDEPYLDVLEAVSKEQCVEDCLQRPVVMPAVAKEMDDLVLELLMSPRSTVMTPRTVRGAH